MPAYLIVDTLSELPDMINFQNQGVRSTTGNIWPDPVLSAVR